MRSKAGLLFALFAGLLNMPVYTVAQQLPPLTHGLTQIQPAYAAPELRLKDLDDQVQDIRQMKGDVVVVNFWATWCPPCRREMASLERLYQSTQGKGVRVIAVNIGEDLDTVFAFLGTVEPSPNFPILLDLTADTMNRWHVKGLPTTFVVTPDGQVSYRAIGGREFDHAGLLDKVLSLRQK